MADGGSPASDMAEGAQSAQRAAREAGHAAQRAAVTNPVVHALARLGFATKGVDYILMGVLAGAAALGPGGKTTDQQGAITTIASQPYGQALLAVVLVGLAGYALWSFALGLLDVEHQGTSAKGLVARAGHLVIGASYALLAYGAFRLLTDTGGVGQSSNATARDWTARLLSTPVGVPLVVAAGIAVIGLGVFMEYRAYTANFAGALKSAELRERLHRTLVTVGRVGYAALGVIFGIIGLFLIVAALRHDPDDARGFGGALLALEREPAGPYLLGAIALGLIAFGLYSLAEARYRRIGNS